MSPAPSYPPSQAVPSYPPVIAAPAAPSAPAGTAAGYAAQAPAATYPQQVTYSTPPSAAPPGVASVQQAPQALPGYALQTTVPASPAPKAKKPLSPVRKGIAAVFGVLGFGSLITAAVLHGLDRRLTPDLSVNSMGSACRMQENAGRTCVLSTVGAYAPTYAVGGLMIAGMILTLTIPESKPRPLSEPLIP